MAAIVCGATAKEMLRWPLSAQAALADAAATRRREFAAEVRLPAEVG